MTSVLVTGGAGFIGSHLAEALLAEGHRVRVLDNLSTGARENLAAVDDAIEFIEGDVTDPATVARAVRGVEVVFHQAAVASVPRSLAKPYDTHAACVTGTLNVLQESRLGGVRRVVYAGSSSAYGDHGVGSNRESDPTGPLSPYGAAKLAGELYCRFHHSFGLETLCIRYFNVFGPRQDPDSPYSAVIPLFITRLLDGHAPVINGDGLQSRDFTYIANVVHGNLLAMKCASAKGQSINVANGRSTSLLELVQLLNEMLGTDLDPVHGPPRAGDIRDSLADITQARRQLGYEPLVQFREGLARTIAYYQAGAKAGSVARSSR